MSADRLRKEIRQTRPFGSLEEEAFLNLQRTAAVLAAPGLQLLKSHGLSAAQYNVLRILRGAGADGLPMSEIGARLIARDPDVTRLVDRLEKTGLVGRRRDGADRRVITVRITRTGLALTGELDEPVSRFHLEQLSHMTRRDLRSLVDLLEAARDRAG